MVPRDELSLNLALALVASSNAPLLLLDGNLNVTAASASFCRTFDIDTQTVAGRPVFTLGAGEWDDPRLHSLLGATLAGAAEIESYEFELKSHRQGYRRLTLHAHLLEYSEDHQVRLLLAASDVTSARLTEIQRDDLVRENAVLIAEVQHRVANSLQIIASVLMQSARKIQSEESRGHLRDAHNRVMSIAALQRHLAESASDEVALAPYIAQLCQSLAASMIADESMVSIVARIDGTRVAPEVSLSLGLLITELVINALKHAFPGERQGKIIVNYVRSEDEWVLSVVDDGIGMKAGGDGKPGLGTSIVEALAKQLQGVIVVKDEGPGTSVTITHHILKGAAANDEVIAQAV